MFQDTELTAYTVLENIILDGKEQKEKLEKVCHISGIDKRLAELPDGVNTIVSKDLSEDGVDFSGGECQKIAIARALYKGEEQYAGMNIDTVRCIAGHKDESVTLGNYCFDRSTPEAIKNQLEKALG